MKEKILLVDGYNMIAFWQETRQLFKKSELDAARTILLEKLSHYASFEGIRVICVFDAQYMPGIRQTYEEFQVQVVFTAEEETADDYIERCSRAQYTLHQVSVATSDLNEQWTVFAQGALRVSARELEKRVAVVKADLNQARGAVNDQKPPIRPFDQEGLRQLQKEMGASK